MQLLSADGSTKGLFIQSTANSDLASKADNFSLFRRVATRSRSKVSISALFSLSTDLVLVSLG